MNNKKKNKTLDNPWNNVLLIIISVVILTIFTMSAPNIHKAGLGGLANLFFPTIFGVFTLLIYFISRLFFKAWNWIITIIGILYITYLSIMLFFDKL